MSVLAVGYGIATLVTLASGLALARAMGDPAPMGVVGLATVLAAANGLGALLIHRRAVGRSTPQFMFWGFAVDGVRLAGLLLFLTVAPALGIQPYESFVVTVMIGFFAFSLAEFRVLHSETSLGGAVHGS